MVLPLQSYGGSFGTPLPSLSCVDSTDESVLQVEVAQP